MNKPNIGSSVRLVMDYPFGPNMIPPEPKTRVIEGTVLAPYKWLNDGQFCLSGDSDFPIRVITMSAIKKMLLLTGSYKKVAETTSKTVAGSKPGVFYTVTKNGSGYTCTCPGFSFRRTCKHLA